MPAYQLTLDSKPHFYTITETVTGTQAEASALAGDMWNRHAPAPNRGWRLRIREIIAPVGRQRKPRLSRILEEIS